MFKDEGDRSLRSPGSAMDPRERPQSVARCIVNRLGPIRTLVGMSADNEIIKRSTDIPSAAAEPFERNGKVVGAFPAWRVGADAAQSNAFEAYADFPRASGDAVATIDRHAVRTVSALAGVALLVVALAACATPPEASVSPPPTASSPPPPRGTPSSSAAPSDDGATALVLPGACADIYSDAMFAHLTATAPPLNDPLHTTPSTELAAGREVLEEAPTLRCTWGGASEYGLSTNVTMVDSGQSTSVAQAAVESGMTCKQHAEGTICRTREDVFVDGELYATVGETHYFRDTGWVATHWTNFAPDGYTEDIVATLWPSLAPTE